MMYTVVGKYAYYYCDNDFSAIAHKYKYNVAISNAKEKACLLNCKTKKDDQRNAISPSLLRGSAFPQCYTRIQ